MKIGYFLIGACIISLPLTVNAEYKRKDYRESFERIYEKKSAHERVDKNPDNELKQRNDSGSYDEYSLYDWAQSTEDFSKNLDFIKTDNENSVERDYVDRKIKEYKQDVETKESFEKMDADIQGWKGRMDRDSEREENKRLLEALFEALSKNKN